MRSPAVRPRPWGRTTGAGCRRLLAAAPPLAVEPAVGGGRCGGLRAAGPGWPDPLEAAVPPHAASSAIVATSGPDRGAAASAMMSAMDPAAYDEFGLFHENASEFGLPWPGPPSVRREDVALTGGGTAQRARAGA